MFVTSLQFGEPVRLNPDLLDNTVISEALDSPKVIYLADKRAAAIEVLTGSPRVKDLIRDGEIEELKEAMQGSEQYGMQTFDEALLALYHAGRISEEEAMKNADSANNLRLKIKNSSGFKSTASFTLQEDEPEQESDDEESQFEENEGMMFTAEARVHAQP